MSSDDIFKGNKVYFSLFGKFLHLLLILRYCSTEAHFKILWEPIYWFGI